MERSRRKVREEKKDIYCRKCQEEKRPTHFYKATDTFLDSNGHMSICRECINEIYEGVYATKNNLAMALLEMCRILNVRFSEGAVEAVKQQLDTYEEVGKEATSIFGMYKSRLISILHGSLSGKADEHDLTFNVPSFELVSEMADKEDYKDISYYQERWGGDNPNLTLDDYLYLDNQLNEWKMSVKCDTHAEEIFLKEVCFIQLDIRNARISGKPVDKLLETFRKMTKESALTPAQQGSVSSGRSVDSFGNWIKDIENKEPAEVWQDMNKYRDMDGIEEDLSDIKRSIKNFMTDSRDFSPLEIEESLGKQDKELLKSKDGSEGEENVKRE
jgi:hypothetical protein